MAIHRHDANVLLMGLSCIERKVVLMAIDRP